MHTVCSTTLNSSVLIYLSDLPWYLLCQPPTTVPLPLPFSQFFKTNHSEIVHLSWNRINEKELGLTSHERNKTFEMVEKLYLCFRNLFNEKLAKKGMLIHWLF